MNRNREGNTKGKRAWKKKTYWSECPVWPGTRASTFYFSMCSRKLTKQSCSCFECQWDKLLEKRTFCWYMHARKWYKCKWFQDVCLRVPGELAISRLPVDWPLGMVSFFNFFSFICVDSCADFSQFQGRIRGVESRWKTNCQRQLWQNHQDLGLAIWRLPVDADRA